MAAMKRKESLTLRQSEGNPAKKAKKDVKEKKKSKSTEPAQTLETETDSEPIVESDTASQSGEDDGASWPSDEGAEEWGGVEVEEENRGGAAKLNKASAKATETVSKSASSEANPCKKIPAHLAFKADLLPASNSRESHAKQKAMAQERKAAKPNADSIARSKKLWERLRRKSHVPPKERKELVAELFGIITGRVKDFVFKHDSVRVIQTALKYANIDQRKMIARELKGEYKALAESKYAKFLIGKILVHGDEETRDLVVPEFYGQVRRMIKHPEASWILDDIYRGIATTSQKATLLREWYGAEFAIFKSSEKGPVSADLTELLAENPEKRSPIIRALHDLINLLLQKKTSGFTMLHNAMLQYFLNVQVGGEEATEFIELIKGDEEGDLLKNLAFTKSGARLACLALAYGTAKDRKQILRTYKGTMQALANDVNGHKVLLTVYDVIDDTVLTSKSVFPELVGKDPTTESQQQELLAAVNHLNARIPFLYLFSGKSKAILATEDLKLLDEIHRIRTTTSKKDSEIRRKELVASLSPPLLQYISENARALVETSFGCQFITEVLLEAAGDRHPAMKAIAALTKGDQETQALLTASAAGRMLKTLVLGGRFNQATKTVEQVDPPLGFHEIFYSMILEDLLDWASGSNSFVVVGLLEAHGFSQVDQLKHRLEKHKTKLIEAAGPSEAGPVKQKGKKVKVSEEEKQVSAPTRNAGTRILLKKLDE